jgi:RHS repeat-associated protein
MNKQRWFLAAILLLVTSFARAQTIEYIHTDALGSPVAVTNSSGAVIERTVYEPYGAVINRPLTNGPGYTGHVADAVTGLNYMQQRYYDPALGRFLSSDPVTATSAGTNFNRYWYGNNNPYKFTDPDGRIVDTVWDIGSVAYDLGKAAYGALSGDRELVSEGLLDAGVDAASALIPFIPAGASKVARAAKEGVEAIGEQATGSAAKASVGKLPKPSTGPGTVPKSERDPKRFWKAGERAEKRAAQGDKCATGCGKEIDASNSRGHHIDRHADGGRTDDANHAEVCVNCHLKLHSP